MLLFLIHGIWSFSCKNARSVVFRVNKKVCYDTQIDLDFEKKNFIRIPYEDWQCASYFVIYKRFYLLVVLNIVEMLLQNFIHKIMPLIFPTFATVTAKAHRWRHILNGNRCSFCTRFLKIKYETLTILYLRKTLSFFVL